VLVDIPVDVSVARCSADGPTKMKLPGYKVQTKGHKRQISMVAKAINESKQPVLYVGGGVIIANASEELRALAEKAHLPVTTTLLGLGSYDQGRAESLDMLGMHGSAYANYAVQECDLLIAVGARFDDRITGKIKTFAPNAKIIHIDIDPSSISKNVRVDIPVVGDAKITLGELVKEVEYQERKRWFNKIAEWKKKFPFRYDNNTTTVKPQHVVEEIYRQTDGKAIITTGVGQNQMWTAQFYKFSRPRQLISSGGLGTMDLMTFLKGQFAFDASGRYRHSVRRSYWRSLKKLVEYGLLHVVLKKSPGKHGYFYALTPKGRAKAEEIWAEVSMFIEEHSKLV